jgi:alkylated DNA repair dioxygenase AlkB
LIQDPTRQLLDRDGNAVLYRGAFKLDFDQYHDAIDWQSETVQIFGRVHEVPRLIAYYGFEPYRYSGIDHPARELTPELEALRGRVEQVSGYHFNSVLCNLYRSGDDGMGYHRDNEREIDPTCIASVSLGASRKFKLRHRSTGAVVSVDLSDGDLLLMLDCQRHWEHAIPKTRRALGPRINLTFRWMIPPVGSRRSPQSQR